MPSLNTPPDTGVQAAGAQDATLVGLRVKLRPCGRCQCIAAHISADAHLRCDSCARTRGRLDAETLRFLRNFVAVFGRPTAPIEIRQTSSLPSGAGAETTPIAPIKD